MREREREIKKEGWWSKGISWQRKKKPRRERKYLARGVWNYRESWGAAEGRWGGSVGLDTAGPIHLIDIRQPQILLTASKSRIHTHIHVHIKRGNKFQGNSQPPKATHICTHVHQVIKRFLKCSTMTTARCQTGNLFSVCVQSMHTTRARALTTSKGH